MPLTQVLHIVSHCSKIENVFGSVILELYRTKLFLLSDLIGMVTLPLADVRHSNKVYCLLYLYIYLVSPLH